MTLATRSTSASHTHSVERLFALASDASARARNTARPVLVSVCERMATVDPLDVLSTADARRMYWAVPEEGFALAGVGAARTLESEGPDRFRDVGTRWMNLLNDAVIENPVPNVPGTGPVLMGGFSFVPSTSRSSTWRGFPDASLTLPRVVVGATHDDCWLTMNVVVDVDGRPDATVAELGALRRHVKSVARRSTSAPRRAGSLLHVENAPDAGDWRALVAGAVQNIRAGAMEKVVLAREACAATPHGFDSIATLRHLRAAYPNCYVFGVWRDDAAFVGASPERLVRLDGREIRTSSLAGSVRRGANPGEDSALAAGLLSSAKDREEHEVVRRDLVAALRESCDDVRAPLEPSVLTLSRVHHLHTPVRGTLRDDRTVFEVVERLHPTPAVGGAPRLEALRFIREREMLDRGWYAGPVGWLQRDRGELAVALRCALLRGPGASLFAGCGIVADSDPDEEYAEATLKFAAAREALAASVAADDAPVTRARSPGGRQS